MNLVSSFPLHLQLDLASSPTRNLSNAVHLVSFHVIATAMPRRLRVVVQPTSASEDVSASQDTFGLPLVYACFQLAVHDQLLFRSRLKIKLSIHREEN